MATKPSISGSPSCAPTVTASARSSFRRRLHEAGRTDPFYKSQTRTTADRLIIAYCNLGDWKNAMTWVDRSYAKQPGRLRRVVMDLPIDRRGLATDPRFPRLMRVAGLEVL